MLEKSDAEVMETCASPVWLKIYCLVSSLQRQVRCAIHLPRSKYVFRSGMVAAINKYLHLQGLSGCLGSHVHGRTTKPKFHVCASLVLHML